MKLKSLDSRLQYFFLMYYTSVLICKIQQKKKRLQENCVSDEKMSINKIILYDFV